MKRPIEDLLTPAIIAADVILHEANTFSLHPGSNSPEEIRYITRLREAAQNSVMHLKDLRSQVEALGFLNSTVYNNVLEIIRKQIKE